MIKKLKKTFVHSTFFTLSKQITYQQHLHYLKSISLQNRLNGMISNLDVKHIEEEMISLKGLNEYIQEISFSSQPIDSLLLNVLIEKQREGLKLLSLNQNYSFQYYWIHNMIQILNLDMIKRNESVELALEFISLIASKDLINDSQNSLITELMMILYMNKNHINSVKKDNFISLFNNHLQKYYSIQKYFNNEILDKILDIKQINTQVLTYKQSTNEYTSYSNNEILEILSLASRFELFEVFEKFIKIFSATISKNRNYSGEFTLDSHKQKILFYYFIKSSDKIKWTDRLEYCKILNTFLNRMIDLNIEISLSACIYLERAWIDTIEKIPDVSLIKKIEDNVIALIPLKNYNSKELTLALKNFFYFDRCTISSVTIELLAKKNPSRWRKEILQRIISMEEESISVKDLYDVLDLFSLKDFSKYKSSINKIIKDTLSFMPRTVENISLVEKISAIGYLNNENKETISNFWIKVKQDILKSNFNSKIFKNYLRITYKNNWTDDAICLLDKIFKNNDKIDLELFILLLMNRFYDQNINNILLNKFITSIKTTESFDLFIGILINFDEFERFKSINLDTLLKNFLANAENNDLKIIFLDLTTQTVLKTKEKIRSKLIRDIIKNLDLTEAEIFKYFLLKYKTLDVKFKDMDLVCFGGKKVWLSNKKNKKLLLKNFPEHIYLLLKRDYMSEYNLIDDGNFELEMDFSS